MICTFMGFMEILWNFFFLTRGARLEEQGWRKEGGERTMVMDG